MELIEADDANDVPVARASTEVVLQYMRFEGTTEASASAQICFMFLLFSLCLCSRSVPLITEQIPFCSLYIS